MDIGVAVRAAAIEVLDRIKRLWLRGVPAAVVAGVAHARHPHLQKLWVAGAVRFMAVRAIFDDGRVFPEERSAAFRVATQAVFVRRALDELLRVRCAMGIVAACTGNFAFAIRHVRGSLQLSAPHLMALETQLWLWLYQAAVLCKRRTISSLRDPADSHSLLNLMAVHARHSA